MTCFEAPLASRESLGGRLCRTAVTICLAAACVPGCRGGGATATIRGAAAMDRRGEVSGAGDARPLRILKGHREFVRSVAFSPDGHILATGSGDYTVRLWDTASWRTARVLRLSDSVNDVAFSPDGKVLAVAARDAVNLWDPSSGQRLRALPQTGGSVAFSPDGTRLAVLGADYGPVEIWPIATWQQPHALAGGKAECFEYSPDGKTLAIGGLDEVELWDTETWKMRRTLKGHWGGSRYSPQGWAKSVAFSRGGRMMAAATGEDHIRIWDTGTWEEVRSFTGPGGPGISSVAFSPDGAVVAAGGMDGNVWEFGAKTGEPVGTLVGHRDWVFCVAFSPDGKLLASGGMDGLPMLWRAPGI